MKNLVLLCVVFLGFGCGSSEPPEPPPMDAERQQKIDAHDQAIEAAESQQAQQ